MGRSQQAQVRQQGNSLIGNENANANTNQTEAQNSFNAANSGFQNLYNNPGYDAATKSAITNATEGGIGAASGAAQQLAANRAARTRNSAGLASSEDELARQRMQTSATVGAQNQITEADAARADKLKSLQGMAGLYGQATGAGLGYTDASNRTLSTLNDSANQKNAFNNAFQTAAGTSLGTFGFSTPMGGGTGSSGCWVAAELFGWNSPEFFAIRNWIFSTDYMKPFAAFYLHFGERWADWIKSHKVSRKITRLLFDAFLKKAVA